jgi:hypothetical protein
MNKNTLTRLNASIPKEFTLPVKQHAGDLNLTPSNFIALCVEVILEMMDAENPSMPYLVSQYRFLRENRQLKSQLGHKKSAVKLSESAKSSSN